MATYSSQYYASNVAAPIKETEPSYTYPYGYGSKPYDVSPPDTTDPSVVSSGGGTFSYGGSSASATGHPAALGNSYRQGSHAVGEDCYDDSVASASGVDINEYMQERFSNVFDPLPLDRSLVKQAQASGTLNAKHRELLELQAKAQARLARSRARFADGVRDAQEVRANLEWTSKKVSSLKKKAEKKHPNEFKMARDRFPSPEY
ncbi:hypothetical protein GGS20DRAFT_499113 [Poronia punctata]|nr:hypothetical protein GGS20DRAFT_499113 [Poronia punctata]